MKKGFDSKRVNLSPSFRVLQNRPIRLALRGKQMTFSFRTLSIALFCLFGCLASTEKSAVAGPPTKTTLQKSKSGDRVDFKRDVTPLFKAHCFQCHAGEQQQGGLRLDTKRFAMKGGISGLTILPGKSQLSSLIQRMKGQGKLSRMPLGFSPLSDAEIKTVALWIDQGAEWNENAAESKHWAYEKPVRRTPPEVKAKSWVRTPIDRFVLSKLETLKLSPSPQASKQTLIRRLSLDLIGIPPTVKETDDFLADKTPDAYSKLVDRLLASPRYGERWARPWLDLARYADSNGYEKDNRRSIWLFRDWVIQALNQDMGYDQFTIEQLAGDLLPNATESQKIATGFQRNTMTNEEGGVDQAEARWLTQVDRVGTTGSVWLGSTLACAQCHDHKYDPFTQKDFYRILAFYDHSTEPALKVFPPEVAQKRAALEKEIHEMEERAKVIRLTEQGYKEFQARARSLEEEPCGTQTRRDAGDGGEARCGDSLRFHSNQGRVPQPGREGRRGDPGGSSGDVRQDSPQPTRAGALDRFPGEPANGESRSQSTLGASLRQRNRGDERGFWDAGAKADASGASGLACD